jgi:hypothetical protein
VDYLNYRVTQSDRSCGAFPDGHPSSRQLFYLTTPGTTNSAYVPPVTVVINEWMADNTSTLLDPADNDAEDWIELYNLGRAKAELGGFYLSTSLTNTTKFRMPEGYSIAPGSYLLVWADNEQDQNSTNCPDLHTNFKLSKNGEAIGLFTPQGGLVDYASFGPQDADVSQGRYPDGGSSITTLTAPTPRSANFLEVPNRPPEISPIQEAVRYEGEWLVFQVEATDPDGPSQALDFTLAAGSPLNASIHPRTGLFSWRPTPDQAGTTHLITVQVTDDGTPPLSTTRSFSVQVLPPPRITAIQPDSTQRFRLTVGTYPGRKYRLEYKHDLLEAQWTKLTEVQATGDSLTLLDETAVDQRFYRLIVVQ